MKIYRLMTVVALALLSASCRQVPDIPFETGNDLTVGPTGGVRSFEVSSPGRWVAITQDSWITVSPANGKGSARCEVLIDSTLQFDQRVGTVSIEDLATNERKEFNVIQNGFDHQITLPEKEKKIKQFADYDSRKFDVIVSSNVDFDVVIPAEAEGWLASTKEELVLDRGARPRKVKVNFRWKTNSSPDKRIAEITFRPKESIEMGTQDRFTVSQDAAERIVPETVAGDSLALLAVSRGLGMWTEWNTSKPMSLWDNVKVWKNGPNKGRVRYVQFSFFTTKEGIPYEIRYLTAAEEISIYGNANSFLHSLDTGEDIAELKNLKRLTIGAYGLTTLNPALTRLKNLESLNLSGNNFQKMPEILNQDNFPSLKTLILNANQRLFVHDLSNTSKKDVGGFSDETTFPEQLLRWNNLDTIRLSVNYLQGSIPDMKDHEKWTAEEVHACDTLPDILIGLPKVLPDTRMFAINLNRLSGKLPDWLLYHPKLDIWEPYSLVFQQEGRDAGGKRAMFSNEPLSLDYYYEHYTNKKFNPNK